MPDDITVFSEADLVKVEGGKIIGSEYPVWYHETMIDELRENIRMDELALKRGTMPEERRHETKQRLDRNRERLDKIVEAVPELDDKQKDYLSKIRKDLGNEIQRMMYSRSQMQKGLADAHGEARRMTEPSIKANGTIYDMAKACNVTVTDGKISRNGAEKIWKICSKRLGEISNTEYLRKD